MANPELVQFIEMVSDPRYSVLFLLLAVWSVAWKGVALWKAGRNSQKKWFIAMLVINTLGILEIVYLFYFSKPPKSLTPP